MWAKQVEADIVQLEKIITCVHSKIALSRQRDDEEVQIRIETNHASGDRECLQDGGRL